ncbi:unnamed protein product, partial [Meganyctiphanes norvegica]
MGHTGDLTKLRSEFPLTENIRSTNTSYRNASLLLTSKADTTPVYQEHSALDQRFSCQSVNDGEQVELTCDVLTHLLPLFGPKMVLQQFGDHIQRGMRHPNEKVRVLIMKQILSSVEGEDGMTEVCQNVPLLLSIIAALGDSSLGVVKYTNKALVRVSSSGRTGLNAVFSSEGITVMQEAMSKSDSCRFNVYEFVVSVCLVGDEALGVVSNCGLLERLVAEVTVTGDILTQLNALELLVPLATSPSGLRLLNEGGVIAKLQYLLSLAETDPMATMLLPGLIKFFGNLGNCSPSQLYEEYGSVLLMVLRLASGRLDLNDPGLHLTAIDTIAYIGETPQGKFTLGKCKTELDEVLDAIGTRIRTAPTDQRVSVLEALSRLFYLPVESQTDDLVGLTEIWWSSVGGVSMEKIIAVSRQPFPELHCAALTFINVLASLPWGQRLINAEPGLVEYILDRSSESDKEGKELKHLIVTTLIHSPYSETILGEDYMKKLTKFYNEGPFYVEANPEVAFAGE